MLVQMQMRRGTTAQWTSANPILASGELGYDSSQSKFKIGDGITAWNSLDFATGATGAPGWNPVFSRQGTLTIATGTQRLYSERTGTVSVARASVGTPSTGSAITVDIKKNGITILSSPISIAAGTYTATGTISISSVTVGDYFTVDINSVGSSTAGANLTATLYIL